MKRSYLFIIFVIAISLNQIWAQTNYYQAPEILSIQQGLSSSKVVSITQDDKGFVWIGTEDGLNKFDGYGFTVYKMKNNDSTSLISNHISTLFYDSYQQLWIGTIKGLQRYNSKKDVMERVNLNQPDYIIKNNQCNYIYEDKNKNLWVASSNIGVLQYFPTTNKSVVFSPSYTQPESSLCSRHIRCIVEDKQGRIWFGSQDKGISVYDPKKESFIHYHTGNSSLRSNAVFGMICLENGDMLIATIGAGVGFFRKNLQTFSFTESTAMVSNQQSVNSSTFCVLQNTRGDLFAGTEGKGLVQINPHTNMQSYFSVFQERKYDIGDSKIHCLFEDKNGNLWIGMHNNGVCLLRKNYTGLRFFRKIYNEPNSLSYGHIAGVSSDKKGNVWFATDGGGLDYFDRQKNTYSHYRYKKNDSNSLSDDAVVSVCCDSKGRVWAGTYIGGLCRFIPSSNQFTVYKHNSKGNSIPSNFVKSIIEDEKGNLWLGTNGGGISYFNPETEKFINFSAEEHKGLVSDNVTKLFIDKDDVLWIGTYFGLSSMDLKTQTFSDYSNDPEIGNIAVYAISQDEKGQIWVGTSNGLKGFLSKEKCFKTYFPKDDNFNPIINGVVPFEDQLWISTNKEIICYLPTEEKVHWLSQSNGIDQEFLHASYYMSPEGEIFFGGNEGCYSFFPTQIQMNVFTPKVYLTGLKIFNSPVMAGQNVDGKVILKENLNNTKRIVLQHSLKSFTLEFTAPDTPFPSSTVFACKMDRFDHDWVVYNNTQRSVSYTNFDPGVYTFRVKASNTPGIWGDEDTSLIIEILPPFWATWWAKLFYLIFIVAVAYVILRIIYIRIKDRNDLRIERLKVKQQEELNQSKMQFFTNISHEFRTPLTLIIDPLEQMEALEKDPEKNQLLKMMLRNANRLLLLINQILDLRKAERGKMNIAVQPIELVSFVKDELGLFSDLARRKKISLSYDYHPNVLTVWFDLDMLSKCLHNLLSNAFKFTPAGGKIKVTIEQDSDERIVLRVKDTGCGMSDKEQEHLFERFYQANSDDYHTGTGIGLHLTYSIIEQHKGSIEVESATGKGSCFSVFIRLGKDHFQQDEIAVDPLSVNPKQELKEENDTSPEIFEEKTDDSKPFILLVEDEEDMRLYIRHELESKYRVVEATNGQEALILIQKQMPDLVITDVMMPQMDGIELCRILKEGTETCHVPIIILTALGDIEHRIKGLETGADSYIPKPFQSRHLRVRIEKLLDLRKKMKERFSHILNVDAEEIDVSNVDEVLLQKAVDYIRTHMENTDLSVEELGKALHMSRTNLHRKIKTMTGVSPIDLIKTIRMKQAAYLLGTGNLTISEVAYKVGYNTPSYFSSSFNAYYNISPTAYIKANVKQKNTPEHISNQII